MSKSEPGCPPPAPTGEINEILLLRHGIAEERQPGLPDYGRALTESGRVRTRAVAERLVAMDLACQGICTSPLVRARQTAEIALESGLLLAGGEFEIEDCLVPGADSWSLIQRLGQQSPPSRWLLVGHEPDLGDLAALLIGAQLGSIPLKKAGIALLRIAPGPAQLRLLLGPKQILSQGGRGDHQGIA